MSYTVIGIDVSRYQASEDGTRRFDWAKARRGAYFAFIRAGVGASGVDFQFHYNLQESKRVGLARGVYHYLKPDKDWRRQADLFASLAVDGQSGEPAGELPPVVDVEEHGGLSKAALNSYLEKFINRFETATGLPLMIYTSPGFWDGAMPLTSWAKNRALWVANYTTAPEPTLPREWGECNQPREWLFWQWTSKGPGAVFGSKGDDDIDLNWFNGSLAEFNSRFGLALAPLGDAEPEPDPEPEPAPARFRMEVTQPGLRIRSGPGREFHEIGRLNAGDKFTPLDIGGKSAWIEIERGAWANVQDGDDRNMEPVTT